MLCLTETQACTRAAGLTCDAAIWCRPGAGTPSSTKTEFVSFQDYTFTRHGASSGQQPAASSGQLASPHTRHWGAHFGDVSTAHLDVRHRGCSGGVDQYFCSFCPFFIYIFCILHISRFPHTSSCISRLTS